jgi:hypothetical protein
VLVVTFVLDGLPCAGVEVSACGPTSTLPPLCPADVDATGDVGLPDLLSVLGSWGACDQSVATGPREPSLIGFGGSGLLGQGYWQVLFRAWSDGSIDASVITFQSPDGTGCGLDRVCDRIPLAPVDCPADIDHNEEVGLNDLVLVLSAWGDCRQ